MLILQGICIPWLPCGKCHTLERSCVYPQKDDYITVGNCLLLFPYTCFCPWFCVKDGMDGCFLCSLAFKTFIASFHCLHYFEGYAGEFGVPAPWTTQWLGIGVHLSARITSFSIGLAFVREPGEKHLPHIGRKYCKIYISRTLVLAQIMYHWCNSSLPPPSPPMPCHLKKKSLCICSLKPGWGGGISLITFTVAICPALSPIAPCPVSVFCFVYTDSCETVWIRL